jgi:preprotein translocase subunit Sec61beta
MFKWNPTWPTPGGYGSQGERWFILDGKNGYVTASGIAMISTPYGSAPLGYDPSQIYSTQPTGNIQTSNGQILTIAEVQTKQAGIISQMGITDNTTGNIQPYQIVVIAVVIAVLIIIGSKK